MDTDDCEELCDKKLQGFHNIIPSEQSSEESSNFIMAYVKMK